MQLHKRGGVTLNGFKINNAGQYYLCDVQKPEMPKQNYTVQAMPLTGDALVTLGSYEPYITTLVIGIKGRTPAQRMARISKFLKACQTREVIQMQFFESSYIYDVQILDEITCEDELFCTYLTVQCLTKPFCRKGTTAQNLAAGTYTIINNGHVPIYPIITVQQNANIICNGSCSIAASTACVIDGTKQIVYTSGTYANKMQDFEGDFIYLQCGANTFTCDAPLTISYTEKFLFEEVSE